MVFFLSDSFPLADKIRQRSVFALDVGSGVVDNIFLSQQLAVGIIDRNSFIDNLYSAAILIDNRGFYGVNRRFFSSATLSTTATFRLAATMLEALVLLNRAVPIRVGK